MYKSLFILAYVPSAMGAAERRMTPQQEARQKRLEQEETARLERLAETERKSVEALRNKAANTAQKKAKLSAANAERDKRGDPVTSLRTSTQNKVLTQPMIAGLSSIRSHSPELGLTKREHEGVKSLIFHLQDGLEDLEYLPEAIVAAGAVEERTLREIQDRQDRNTDGFYRNIPDPEHLPITAKIAHLAINELAARIPSEDVALQVSALCEEKIAQVEAARLKIKEKRKPVSAHNSEVVHAAIFLSGIKYQGLTDAECDTMHAYWAAMQHRFAGPAAAIAAAASEAELERELESAETSADEATVSSGDRPAVRPNAYQRIAALETENLALREALAALQAEVAAIRGALKLSMTLDGPIHKSFAS